MNNMIGSSRKRGIGGVNFQGKFGGRPKRFRSSKLAKGYAERVTYAAVQSAPQCAYLGFTSIPCISQGVNPGYSRLLADICIAILRQFFRSHFPGKIEFETPDQVINAFGCAVYNYNVQFRNPTGQSFVDSSVFSSASNQISTTLRDMANNMASIITAQWRLGLVPTMLYAYVPTGDTSPVPVGTMWLNNLRVKCSCTNVITVQNQSLADDGAIGDLDANTTVDVSANPLRGRIYYMRHVTPEVGVGLPMSSDATVTDDLWGSINLRRMTDAGSTLSNVLAPTAAATGCWKVLPKPEYFKNCSRIKDIGLEPGVQKTMKLRFNFHGTLTNFLRGEYNNYAVANQLGVTDTSVGLSLQSGLKMGFGQIALMAFEKRLRQTGSLITVAYQIDSYIRTSIYSRRQYMVYHVETNV